MTITVVTTDCGLRTTDATRRLRSAYDGRGRAEQFANARAFRAIELIALLEPVQVHEAEEEILDVADAAHEAPPGGRYNELLIKRDVREILLEQESKRLRA